MRISQRFTVLPSLILATLLFATCVVRSIKCLDCQVFGSRSYPQTFTVGSLVEQCARALLRFTLPRTSTRRPTHMPGI